MRNKMMFYRLAVFVISFHFLVWCEVESADHRKVLVKEIRFFVSPRDVPFNGSVKNGVDNEPNAPDTKLFQAAIIKGTESESTLFKQYFRNMHANSLKKESKITKRHIKSIAANVEHGKEFNHKQTFDENNKKSSMDEHIFQKISRENNEKNRDLKNPGGNEDSIEFPEYVHDDELNEVNVPTSKIVGGTLSLPTTWPWQVSIQYFGADNYWHHFCGGSLIDRRWVVTAAHCVCRLSDYMIRVVLGDYRLSVRTHREQVIDPARMLVMPIKEMYIFKLKTCLFRHIITKHAYYEETSYYFDIAMIKLADSAIITSYVETVEMSTPREDTFSSINVCYITGWGNTIGTTERIYTSDYLLQSQVTLISRTSCRHTYGNIIEDTQTCITGENTSACSGDSGGPLVCQNGKEWRLVGIASLVGNATCSPEYPNVYTRMSSFHEWSTSVMTQY